MTLGEKISKLRTVYHLSQDDLAEKMGVSIQVVSKWETGDSDPDLNKLVRLSELFNVTVDALIKEGDSKHNTDSGLFVSKQTSEKYPARKIGSH
jgi:transcriptional regulator with XRE-family HTH domain